MAKLSNLIGNIPAIDSYLRYDGAYKIKPKAKQMTELQEAVLLKQQHNKTLQEAANAQGVNSLGIDATPFIPQIQKLDAELDNLEAIYGLDVTKSS